MEQAGGVVSLLAAAGLAGLLGLLWQRRAAWLALTGASCSALAGVLWILRNPERSAPDGHGLVVAPSDGAIRSIDLVQEPRFLKGMAYQVTIRLRSAEVQVTRAPVAGTVRYRRYQPRAQAGELDDSLWIGLRQQDGARVLVRLTASSFWRVDAKLCGPADHCAGRPGRRRAAGAGHRTPAPGRRSTHLCPGYGPAGGEARAARTGRGDGAGALVNARSGWRPAGSTEV
jgi:hypothetical protein